MGDLPKNVSHYKDRHGKTRYRFRQKGMLTRQLPGSPGDPEFESALADARAGRIKASQLRKEPPAQTLRAAWLEVKKSIEFKQLKQSSKDQQTGVAERFLLSPTAPGSKVTMGQLTFNGFSRNKVKTILGRYADRPHAGYHVLKFLRKIAGVAIDSEWIENDPTYRIKFRPKTKGHRAWTDLELIRFENHWPVGTKERLGYTLARYTGQRRADVPAMTWAAYTNGGIAVVQEKTGAPLWIPAHPVLVEVLAATPRAGEHILLSRFCRGFTTESFGNLMADAIAAAGLPDDCVLHGLRKTAGRCLAEAGATTKQIMAVTGHKTLSEVERYTAEAEQKRLATQAIETLSRPRLTILPGGK